MIKFFLKAKHWQVFLLSVGLYVTLEVLLEEILFNEVKMGKSVTNDIMNKSYKYSFAIDLISAYILFAWFWSIAIGLQHKIPVPLKMTTTKFKLFFFIPLHYVLGLYIFNFTTVDHSQTDDVSPSILIILPFHLFFVFCWAHTLYFTAKTIKTVQLQREVHWSDFAKEFFLLLVYPVGIWIIQPKLNALIKQETTPSPTFNS